ncbi:MAG: adenine deaminase C-terminal domain-containing protein, partial [candidate division WOR-3 bacterium]
QNLALRAKGSAVRVIRIVPNQIVTSAWETAPKVEHGMVVADLERDILKLAVIERHHRTGNVGLGLVHGFGLKKGALASSVAHDAHNVVVVGTNDKDMLTAARRIQTVGGGLVAASGGKSVAELPLPIGGLMTQESPDKVAARADALRDLAHNWGSRLSDPFATLSFLSLPVVPELRLTDHGLVDVPSFKVVPLWLN